MALRLFDSSASSFCIRPRSILDFKGLAFERLDASRPAVTAELRRRGGIGKLPALDVDGEPTCDSTDIARAQILGEAKGASEQERGLTGRWAARGLLFGASALLALAAVECKSGASGGSAILAKPVGKLERADLEGVCVALGWTNDGVSSSRSVAVSQAAASCSREEPEGIEGPDGKKRAYLTVAIYNDGPTGMARFKNRAESEQGAYVEGAGQLLAVSQQPPSRERAQALLARLVGK